MATSQRFYNGFWLSRLIIYWAKAGNGISRLERHYIRPWDYFYQVFICAYPGNRGKLPDRVSG